MSNPFIIAMDTNPTPNVAPEEAPGSPIPPPPARLPHGAPGSKARQTRIKKAGLKTVVERYQPYNSSNKEMENSSVPAIGSIEEKMNAYKQADCYEHTWNYPSAPIDVPDQNPLLVNGPLSNPNLIDPAFVDLADMTKPHSPTCQLWLRKYDMSSSAVLGINGTDIGSPKEYYQTLNLREIKGDGIPSEGVALAPFAFKFAIEGLAQFGLEKYDHVGSKRYFEALRGVPKNLGGLGSLNDYSEAQLGQMRNPLRHVNPTLRQVITNQQVAKNLFFLDFQAMVAIVDIYDQELKSGVRTTLPEVKYEGLSGHYTLFNAFVGIETVGQRIMNSLKTIKDDLAAGKESQVDDVAKYLYYKRRAPGTASFSISYAEVGDICLKPNQKCENLFDGEAALADYLAYPVILAVPIASDYISVHELNCYVDPIREVRSKRGGYEWIGTHKAKEALSFEDTYYQSAQKKVAEMQADHKICGPFPERARTPQNCKGYATNVVNAGARVLSKVSIRRLVRTSSEGGAEFWKLETRLHRIFAENTLYPGYNGSYLTRLIKQRYAGLEFLGSLAVCGMPSMFGVNGLQCIVPLIDLGTLRTPKFTLGGYGMGKYTECTGGVIARASGAGNGEDWGQPASSLVDLYSNRNILNPAQMKAENYDMNLVVLNASLGDEADVAIQREGVKNLEKEIEKIVDSILDSVVPFFKLGSREGPGLDITEKLEEGDITIKVACFREEEPAAVAEDEKENVDMENNTDRVFLTIQAKLPFRSVRVEDTNGQVPERVPLFAAYQGLALENGIPFKGARIQDFHKLYAQKPFRGIFEVGIPYCFVKYDVEKQELSIKPIYHTLQVVAF